MFDFRYHVASLAAVFLALVVGIVVGVGLSGQGLVRESERETLNDRIEALEAELARADTAAERQRAAEDFVEAAYPALMEGRLADRRFVVVFVGATDGALRSAVSRTITDAGGTIVRLRALKVPVDGEVMAGTVGASSELAALVSARDVRAIGRALAAELLEGGETPLWNALAAQLVIERTPNVRTPADGVVVVRTADVQRGASAEFLNGLYDGLSGDVPAVWVERPEGGDAQQQARRPDGFSAVHGVDTALGRVALAVLLETGVLGEYGPGADAVVPPIAPVEPPADEGG